MRNLLFLICLSTLCAGCGADATTCATGNWVLTGTTGTGNCAAAGTTFQTAITVTDSGSGYNVQQVGDPNSTFSGTVRADGDRCILSGTFTTSGVGSSTDPNLAYNETDTINVSEEGGSISGSGSLTVAYADNTTCSQVITFTGLLQ